MRIKDFFNIENWGQELGEVWARFPLPSLTAIFLFLFSALTIFDVVINVEYINVKIILSLVTLFFFFITAALYAETHDVDDKKFPFIVGGGAVFIVGMIGLYYSGKTPDIAVFVLATFLSLWAAPFIFKENNNYSFWCFGKAVGFGIGGAFLIALIFFAGVAAALGAIEFLFDLNWNGDIFVFIWSFSAMILAPFYAMTFIPKITPSTQMACDLPKQIGFIGNWILVPIMWAYIAILYAYLIKIGVTMDIPKGELAYMITGFASVGIVTYLVVWPYWEEGLVNKAADLFMRFFFLILAIPVVMQMVAIFIRINEYGMTENRYLILVAGVWFAFLSIGFAIKKLRLKHIFISLALLLFIVSWGPWGMSAVSTYSQKARLENILIENDLIENDEIITHETTRKIPYQARLNISDVYRYLDQKIITKEDRKKLFYGYDKRRTFFEALGFEEVYGSYYEDSKNQILEGRFYFNADRLNYRSVIDVQKSDFIIPNFGAIKADKHDFNNRVEIDFLATIDNKNFLILSLRDIGQIKIFVEPVVRNLLKNNPKREPLEKPIFIKGNNDQMSIKLEVLNISGELEEDKIMVENLGGRAFITLR